MPVLEFPTPIILPRFAGSLIPTFLQERLTQNDNLLQCSKRIPCKKSEIF